MVGDESLIDRLSSLIRRPDGFGGRCGGRSGWIPARLCFRAGTTGGVLEMEPVGFKSNSSYPILKTFNGFIHIGYPLSIAPWHLSQP